MSNIPQFVSVFEGMQAASYPVRFEAKLGLTNILGGTPTNSEVIEAWMRTKIGLDKDDEIRAEVARIVAERNIPEAEAASEVAKNRSLSGFLRDRCKACPQYGPLCDAKHQVKISGRQLKACLKEAASVAVASGKLPARGWGTTNKGLLAFFAEHFFVVEDDLLLVDRDGQPVTEDMLPDPLQHFVHTRFGSAIQYHEWLEGVTFEFTVIADYYLTDEEWALIWTTAQLQGLGASRSQGYGRFFVTQWNDFTPREFMAKAKAAKKRLEDKLAAGDDEKPAAPKKRALKAVA